MITAHAPAGYIGAQLLYRLKPATVSARAWSLYGVASGLLPDIDMLWFYLVDHGHVHHRTGRCCGCWRSFARCTTGAKPAARLLLSPCWLR